MREDGLVLYKPQKTTSNSGRLSYEIVLHRPTTETLIQTFSLFRANTLDDAKAKFTILHDKLPVFIEIAKEVGNTEKSAVLLYLIFR